MQPKPKEVLTKMMISKQEDTINKLNNEKNTLTEIIESLETDKQQLHRTIQQKSLTISSLSTTNTKRNTKETTTNTNTNTKITNDPDKSSQHLPFTSPPAHIIPPQSDPQKQSSQWEEFNLQTPSDITSNTSNNDNRNVSKEQKQQKRGIRQETMITTTIQTKKLLPEQQQTSIL